MEYRKSYEYEGIFGKTETAHLERTLHEFFELAATIRRTGSASKKICWTSTSPRILATLLYLAEESGFSASSELLHLCVMVMGGKTDRAEYPL